MSRHLRILFAAALVFLAAGASAQTIIYVSAGAAGTGTCAAPFGNLRAAINAARTAPGASEIRIAAGSYASVDDRNLRIDFSNVAIKGGYPVGFGGCPGDAAVEALRNTVTNVCTLEAADQDRIARILPELDPGPDALPDTADDIFIQVNTGITIDGLVFRNGKPAQPGPGGALLVRNCTVTLSNNLFDSNTTNDHFFGGGAIYLVGYDNPAGSFNDAQINLNANRFVGNSTGEGLLGSGPGGALFAWDLNISGAAVQRRTVIEATNNTFLNNISNGSAILDLATYCPDDNGDGIPDGAADCNADGAPETCLSRSIGGAVSLNNVSGTWSGNQFEGNQALARQTAYSDASGQGGAFHSFARTGGLGVSPVLTNNVFTANIANAGRGSTTPPNACGYFSAWGGAAYLVYFDTAFSENIVENNVADAAGNSAPQGAWGGGVFIIPASADNSTPLISGNQFRGNEARAGGGELSGWGGGLLSNEFNLAAGPVVTNNIFDGNSVTGAVGGSGYGGGLMVNASGYSTRIVGNTITNNIASGVAGQFSGIGGGLRAQLNSTDQLIADNIVSGNGASDIIPGLNFAGIALLAAVENDPTGSPRVQNNLIVENQGAGLGLIGFPTAGGFAFCSPPLINNTIAANDGTGILMNLSDEMLIQSTIIWDNDRSGIGVGDIVDEYLNGSRPSEGQILSHSALGVVPAAPPDLIASANDPLNNNQLGVDPRFAASASGAYFLRQPPDNTAPFSTMVNAGPVLASAQDYGTNPGAVGRNMNQRTTRTGTGIGQPQSPDTCFVDLGFHYPPGVVPVDGDGDGLPDADELGIGTNPADADTDDDGVLDGADCGGDIDGDGTIAALDCDSDGDAVTDGTESGVTTAVLDADTNTSATCNTANAPCGSATSPTFTSDADPASTTDPLNADTDGGGELDGCEDVDHDGRNDGGGAGERNPNMAGDDDADRDGLNNGIEGFLGSDPNDADSDDDGVSDSQEIDSDPLNCDTDGDTILDGIELGLGPVADPDGAAFPARGTDCPANPQQAVWCQATYSFCDVTLTHPNGPDCTPGTADDGQPCYGDLEVCDCIPGNEDVTLALCTTFPVCEGTDTDGDGVDTNGDGVIDVCGDGQEDANHNGRVDAGESDPTTPGDCSLPGLTVNIDDRVTLLNDSTPGTPNVCGMNTSPTADSMMATACTAPITTGCQAPAALAAPTRSTIVAPGTPTTLAGEAAPGFEAGVLVFYELRDCGFDIIVRKSGSDLILEAQ